MKWWRTIALIFAGSLFAIPVAFAHDAPTSFLDLHTTARGLDLVLTSSTTDLAHDLPAIEPDMLLQPAALEPEKTSLSTNVLSRLTIKTDGRRLTGELVKVEPLPEKKDLRITLHFALEHPPRRLHLQCQLFPYDPRHRTFANFYDGARLEQQEIFDGMKTEADYLPGAHQKVGLVVRQFLLEGVHHIFLGPDHILFVVGLLLLGGSVKQLLKVVTAFTVAHSVTLGLATFKVVSPPASLVEPAIALSIIFVGMSALFANTVRDPRLLIAFSFGLVHGFGFARALQEMALPRQAISWSLFAFNGGVEIGQACIVMLVAPFLILLRQRNPALSERVVGLGALGVVTAGAFWFFQRVITTA
jgi:hydrogenase/urease accessory protein HupE